MTYQEIEQYINDIPKFSSKNVMADTILFLQHMKHPDRNMNIVHVAGTNGKGSVCAYLTSFLKGAGYKVGTFISPHLVTMRERFLIDGKMISEEVFVEAFEMVQEYLKTMPDALKEKQYHPSFFEFLFFMGMLIYDKQNVEYLVLETGLGGRLDATNAVERKKLSIITSIGYDHMEYLGETLEEIASEKAGIIKKEVPIVYLKREASVAQVIEAQAKQMDSLAYFVPAVEEDAVSISESSIDFSFQSLYYKSVPLVVSGCAIYQVENISLALRGLEILALDDKKIRDWLEANQIQEAINQTFWEGRMEQIYPNIYLDGAHNTDGIRAFLNSVECTSQGRKRVLLYSVVKDKQYELVMRQLADSKLFSEIHIVQMTGYRALAICEMQKVFDNYDVPYVTHDTIKEAIDSLKACAKEDTVCYIVGSLYLAGEVKQCMSMD